MSDEQTQETDQVEQAPEITVDLAERQVDRAMTLIKNKDLDGALSLLLPVDTALRGGSQPEARIQFARAVNGLGFIQLMKAKQARATVEAFEDTAEQTFRWEVKQALARFEHALATQADPRYRSYVEGNKAYALILLDRLDDARKVLSRLFTAHGRVAYDGQVEDTEIYPIPEDRSVRRMIDEIWEETNS